VITEDFRKYKQSINRWGIKRSTLIVLKLATTYKFSNNNLTFKEKCCKK